jgi:hypothetical protein
VILGETGNRIKHLSISGKLPNRCDREAARPDQQASPAREPHRPSTAYRPAKAVPRHWAGGICPVRLVTLSGPQTASVPPVYTALFATYTGLSAVVSQKGFSEAFSSLISVSYRLYR